MLKNIIVSTRPFDDASLLRCVDLNKESCLMFGTEFRGVQITEPRLDFNATLLKVFGQEMPENLWTLNLYKTDPITQYHNNPSDAPEPPIITLLLSGKSNGNLFSFNPSICRVRIEKLGESKGTTKTYTTIFGDSFFSFSKATGLRVYPKYLYPDNIEKYDLRNPVIPSWMQISPPNVY